MGPVLLLSVLTCVLSLSSATLCGGRQFWDFRKKACSPCSECPPDEVVLRPCQPHSDTRCGPLSALNIDWSWLPSRNSSSSSHKHNRTSTSTKPHHHHHHHRGHHHQHQHRHHAVTPPQPLAQVKVEDLRVHPTDAVEATASTQRVRQQQQQHHHTEPPFSATETLVWDWQVLVLGLAVCACVIFFVVTGIYSIHHARQWRRFKSTFEADVEELSAQLSLMSPSSLMDSTSAECAYLEQLLVQKQHQVDPCDSRGNVYIAVAGGGSPPRM